MRLLPGPAALVLLGRLVPVAMQPGMPFRRHQRGLDAHAIRIDHPALLALRIARLLLAIILVAVLVLADEFAVAPRIEFGTD